MGIIILPFLLGGLIISLMALIDTFKLIMDKEIAMREIVFGLLITVVIFGFISLSYVIEGRAWGLSPAFRLPICMIFIPFGIYTVVKSSNNAKTKYFSRLLLVSIGLSGVLGLVFNEVFFDLIDYLGIEKYY
ncbi:hypothetical protein GCM10011375_17110 [Hymenobacter qilianensis]|uniref:Uncharacterized protein n=1 Tax=Hymenobacter qilianensis TaxID=1385715 RepID=A0ACB5PQM5_9BACT|nr:hypothetical protein GCM10011375_17110 [Hymenobacter qilianensis]